MFLSAKRLRLIVGALLGLVVLLVVALLLTLRGRQPDLPADAPRAAVRGGSGGSGDGPDEQFSALPPEAEDQSPGGVDAGVGPVDFDGFAAEGDVPLQGEGPAVTAPVDLPPGLYRFTFQTDGSFDTVGPVVEEGQCGDYPFFIDEPAPFEGSATYRSLDCRVHFEVTNPTGQWAIAVEAVTTDQAVTVPTTFSGDRPTTTGPVYLPRGRYLLAISTDSPYSMITPIIIDGLCMERSVLVLTEPGHLETPYYSDGCQIVFQIGNVTDHWEFSVAPLE